MFIRAWRWLFHRRKQPVSPAITSQDAIAGEYSAIEADIADDPGMCRPLLSKPTAHITRVIDGDETIADDDERTLTMETAVVGV